MASFIAHISVLQKPFQSLSAATISFVAEGEPAVRAALCILLPLHQLAHIPATPEGLGSGYHPSSPFPPPFLTLRGCQDLEAS